MADGDRDVTAIALRLRKHLPFLRQMLANLSEGCAQHSKISALCDIISKTSKVKYATLEKCEKVITLLQTKPHRKAAGAGAAPAPMRQADIICLAEADTTAANLTPDGIRSPSPSSTCSGGAVGLGERYEREKPSIYASAAETLDRERAPAQLLDVLPAVDTSKPPISAEELELLTAETSARPDAPAAGAAAAGGSGAHAEHALAIRSKVSLVPAPFNKKARKAHAKPQDAAAARSSDAHSAKTAASPKKVEKIIDGDSVFGNLLSSLDEKLIGDERKRRDSKDGDTTRRPRESRDSHRKQISYKLKKIDAQLAAWVVQGGDAPTLEKMQAKRRQYKKQLEACSQPSERKRREKAKQADRRPERSKHPPRAPHPKPAAGPSPEPVFSPNDDDADAAPATRTPASPDDGDRSPFAVSQIQTHASYLNFQPPPADRARRSFDPPDDIRTPADPFSSYIPKARPPSKDPRLQLKHNPNPLAERWTDPPLRKAEDCGWGTTMESAYSGFDPFAPVPTPPAPPTRCTWQAYPRSAQLRWSPAPPPPPPRPHHAGDHFKPFAPIGNEYDLSRMQPQDFYQPLALAPPPPSVPSNYRQWRELKQRDEERKRLMARSEQMEFRRMRQKENEAKQSLEKKKCELERLEQQQQQQGKPMKEEDNLEASAPAIYSADSDSECADTVEAGEHKTIADDEEAPGDKEPVDPQQLLKIISEAKKQKKAADGGTYLPAHVVELMESLLKTGATKSGDALEAHLDTGPVKEEGGEEEAGAAKKEQEEQAAGPEDEGAAPFVRNLRRRTKKINYNEIKIVSVTSELLDEVEGSPGGRSRSCSSSSSAGVPPPATPSPKKVPPPAEAVTLDQVKAEPADAPVEPVEEEKKVRGRRGRKRKTQTSVPGAKPASAETASSASRDSSAEVKEEAAPSEAGDADEKPEMSELLLAKSKSLKVVLHKLEVTPKRPRLARASKMGVSYDFNAMLAHKSDALLDDAFDDPQERADRLAQTIDEVARNQSDQAGPAGDDDDDDEVALGKRKPSTPSATTTTSSSSSSGPKRAKRDVKLEPEEEEVPAAVKKYEDAPDKNYYLKSDANPCRLCASVGSMAQIVLHYLEEHGDAEVLISRLSPVGTQEAFQEAVINEYAAAAEGADGDADGARRPPKMDFRCRFCSHDLHNELPATFFDHVSGHTGEARYHCTLCDFKHNKRLTVKTHMSRAHRRGAQEPRVDDVPDASSGMLFGYICSECNYLQMRKAGVQAHIERHHNPDTTYAYVINMSLPTLQRRGAPAPKPPQVDGGALPAAPEAAPPSADLHMPRTRSSQRLQKLKQAEAVERASFEIVDFDLPELLTAKPAQKPQPPPSPPPLQLKSAFVCENLDEMLKSSPVEAPVTIAPSPKRSSFLDQLKKRLDGAGEMTPLPVTLQPPIDIEVTCTSDMDVEDDAAAEAAVPKDKQPAIKVEGGAPAKAKPPMKLLSVSVVDAVFGKTDSVLYVCRKPACIFQTTARRVLAAHCNYTHPDDTDALVCNVCYLQAEPMPMIDVFEHLCRHVDEYLLSPPPPPPPSPSILHNALAVVKREAAQPDDVDSEKAQPPRFSFKIEKVESLAEPPADTAAPAPDAGDAAEAAKSNSLVCKLVAMSEADLVRPRKAAHVMAKWIADDELRFLFKCPQPECDFVCHSDTFFDQHLATHDIRDALVQCLYCNYKMREEYVKVHLLMRHARSKFGCGYCLYRALKRLYVTIHHKAVHPEKMLNIHHNVQTTATSRFRAPSLPLVRGLVKCYTCRCGKKFVLTKSYEHHLKQASTCRSPLKCAVCQWSAPTMDALILHSRWHSVFEYVCRYCEFGDASSGNVLQHIALQHPFHEVLIITRAHKDPKRNASDEEEFPSIFDNLLIISEQQVKIAPEPATSSSSSSSSSAPVDDGAEEEASSSDERQLPAAELFQCIQCSRFCDGSSAFLAHVTTCTFNTSLAKPYECRHCGRSYKHARDLVDHMRVHGVKNLSCGLCGHKEGHQAMLRKHIKLVHKLSSIQILPMNPAKTNIDVDEFIAKPAIGQAPKQAAAAAASEPVPPAPPALPTSPAEAGDAAAAATVFDATDIDKLPKMPIFKFVARCKICDYATKVRSNFVRHMGMHATGKIDPSQPVAEPVNPVPCLEKNELMFDKMTNLAASSHVGGRMGGRAAAAAAASEVDASPHPAAPQYIAGNKRYVCGAPGCNYLCLEEQNLRHHLQALHDNEQRYTCVHCREPLTRAGKSFIDIDAIVAHLRLHESALFRCGYCDELANSRPHLERHCADKHADKAVKALTIRNLVAESDEGAAGDDTGSSGDAQQLPPPATKKKRVWRCGVCSCRKTTEPEIRAHVAEKHSLHAQFTCIYCQFTEEARDAVDAHIAAVHPGLGSDIIVGYFKEEAREKDDGKAPPGGENLEGFDTTPLWVKNRTGNVKHIRGILLDENEAAAGKGAKAKSGGGQGKRRVSLGRPSDVPPLAPLSTTVKDEASVIEILDDADAEDEEPSVDALNPSLSQLSNMPIALLQQLNCMSTYGPLGRPNGTCYACPLCEADDIGDEEAFHQHLCEELHYNRFQCMLCAAQTTTYKRMKEHYTAKHLALCDSDSVKSLQVNASIDLWIRKVHTVQTRLIKHNREQQQQQQQKSRQAGPRKVMPFFVCGHCRYTVMSQNELLAHSGAAHPRKEIRMQKYFK